MELGDYLAVLRKHWLGIALIGALGFGLAYGYSTTLPETYRATASVLVSAPSGETVGEAVQGATYAQGRIESYAQLATKPYVLEPVIERLELDTTPRSLARNVTVTRPLNTYILDIAVVDGTPSGAAEIADAISVELADAVYRLEKGPDGSEPSVAMTVVAPATPPPYAFGPNTKLNAATGLAAGLAVGVALALARSLLDTRVRSARDLRRVTGAAVLSTIRHDRRTGREPLAMRRDPFGEQAESYRRLRTNLRFLNLSGPSRSIMVTSAIPGEGKSTLAINLAMALAEGASRVLLIDADLRRPSVARYLGLEGAVGLTTILIGEARPEDVIQRWGDAFDVLPAGQVPPNPSELLDSAAMGELLASLAPSYDVVLVDSAPLLPVTDSAALSRFVDGALLVVGCHKVHRDELAGALTSLAAVDARILGLALNRVPSRESGSTYVYGSTPRATARELVATRLGRRGSAGKRASGRVSSRSGAGGGRATADPVWTPAPRLAIFPSTEGLETTADTMGSRDDNDAVAAVVRPSPGDTGGAQSGDPSTERDGA